MILCKRSDGAESETYAVATPEAEADVTIVMEDMVAMKAL